MKNNSNPTIVREIMLDFASETSLQPVTTHPKRYLWTDAFAVCNYLELYLHTNDKIYKDLSLQLVDQVHHTLGKHRDDDTRTGWISGLPEKDGELHPTKGGLRIGKPLKERGPGETLDQRLEWDQDGQYYHYLTKWMHALNRMSRVLDDPIYSEWAMELAQTAHARFTYLSSRESKRMYWKMSIDLSYPLVPSMGQHDPLDGFITYSELQFTSAKVKPALPDLSAEITDMASICQGQSLATDDPLGIGGLLFDATRLVQLMKNSDFQQIKLLESILDAALWGLESFVENNSLKLPSRYRLAFRELGLSIGLAGVEKIMSWMEDDPELKQKNSLKPLIEALTEYVPLCDTIHEFWLDSENRNVSTWTDHQEINMVMLATSLVPDGFLMI